jgi:hypothetical protein
MIVPPETRDLARRLLACEAVAGESSEQSDFAVSRVYAKLRRSLCALAGVAGFQALASRALTLAQSEDPSLSAVRVTADGSLQGLDELLRQIDPDEDQAGQADVILIAQLLGLLFIFIGKVITSRVVQDIWPDAVCEDRDSGGGEL